MMGEDVELCLEVQVDPESKRILSNPEKCRSTLLDVTVVKPKEMEAFGTQRTNTLRADEVRKLISSMEKQRRKKQKVLEKLKYDDTIIQIRKHDDAYDSHHRTRKPFTKQKERILSKSPIDDLERKDFIGIAESVEPLFCEIRRSLKNVETRITNMQDINLVISQTTVDETASEEYVHSKHKPSYLVSSDGLRNHSVYRVETTPHDLKSILCQDKKKLLLKEDKIEGKCLCENCGIVGLLTECQKHPLLSELSESPAPSTHKCPGSSKKRTRFNIANVSKLRNKNYDDGAYLNLLSDRIKLLEERIAMQEEKVVPKDYFKKIITKLVNNFSPKTYKSKSDTSLTYQYKHRKKSSLLHQYMREKDKNLQSKSIESFNCYNMTARSHREKPLRKNDKATVTDEELYYSGFIWRWGEEILRPGIDLKNRIVTLLNDILYKFGLPEKAPPETTRKEKCDSQTFKKFMKHMNANVYNSQFETKFMDYKNFENVCHFVPYFADSPERTKPRKDNKNIDVSYVNPKISLWRKESPDNKTESCPSPMSSRIKSSPGNKMNNKVYHQRDSASPRNISSESYKMSDQKGRQEFLKIISKAKPHQKEILWKNIWNQAKANGQTKEDKITIKIPTQSKGSKDHDMFETEITIGEVEQILKCYM